MHSNCGMDTRSGSRRRTKGKVFALGISLSALLAWGGLVQAQQKIVDDLPIAGIEAPTSCGLGSAMSHVRIGLGDLGIARGPETVRVDISLDGEALFTEHYTLGADVATTDGLPLWLGGNSNREAFEIMAQGGELEFTFFVGDRLSTSLGLADLLAAGQRSKQASSALASVQEMTSTYRDVTVQEADFVQKTFQCPNAFPQCDYENDYCWDNCVWSPNSSQCLQQCQEAFQECVFGSPRFTTIKTLQSYSPSRRRCGNDPAIPTTHWWDEYNVVWRYDRYRSVYCRTNGQTYNQGLDSTWTENGKCYLDAILPCGPRDLTLSGGSCIWRFQAGGP